MAEIMPIPADHRFRLSVVRKNHLKMAKYDMGSQIVVPEISFSPFSKVKRHLTDDI